MPTPRSTFVSPLLTNIYVGYSGEQNYVADVLFPTLTVNKETGTYFVRDKENLRAPADARRGEFDRANRVTNTLTSASFTLEEKSLESPISWKLYDQYDDPFEPKKNATMLVKDKLKLDNELDAYNTVVATASGSNTLDTSASWATISTDIIGQVRTGKTQIHKTTGKKANVIVLSKLAYDAVLKNTAFIESVKYNQNVTEEGLRNALAAWFDVETVVVADAINNTAKEGQSDSLDYIWGELVVIAYVTRTPALETPTAGYKLQLEKNKKTAAEVDEWSEQDIKTDFVRATDYYDNKVVDSNCFYIITNTV